MRLTALICWMMLLVLTACQSADEDPAIGNRTMGVTDDTIRIGSSLALGGHAGYLGTQTLHGAREDPMRIVSSFTPMVRLPVAGSSSVL